MNYWYLTTWMDLENISGERNQKKDSMLYDSSMDYPRKGKTPVTESSSVVTSTEMGKTDYQGGKWFWGWWNYSKCFDYGAGWMTVCWTQKRWILLYVNIPHQKEKHGRKNHQRINATLFRLNPLYIEKLSTVSLGIAGSSFSSSEGCLSVEITPNSIFPEAHSISICDLKFWVACKLVFHTYARVQSFSPIQLCSSMGQPYRFLCPWTS